jgi:hypothetical protein
MQFGAQHIAVGDFDHFDWLRPIRPVDSPTWYYWTLRNEVNPGSWVDLSTVDSLLHDMVACAQEAGVRTLPSCQGHFPKETYFDEQMRFLSHEEGLIREGRLLMENVETGRVSRPRVPRYRMPPPRWLKFGIDQARGRGRVGFVFEERAPAVELTVLAMSVADARCDGHRVSIQVVGRSPNELRLAWGQVEQMVFDVCGGL